MSNPASILQIFDLALGVIGFLSAYVLYSLGSSDPAPFRILAPGLIISILTFWFCTERQDADPADAWVVFIELLSLSMGLNLIIQALLTYFLIYQHIPLVVIFTGGVLSSTLLAAARKWMEAHLPVSRKGVLLVGFDPQSYALVRALRQPIVGVLELDEPLAGVPAEIPLLGSAESLAKVVRERHPSRIVVASENWESQICAQTLLNCRLSGIIVNDTPSLDEKLLYRISAGRYEPSDFVLSPALTPNRRAMAIQSIYTNLIGLALLLVSLPLMLLVALAVALFSDRGPVFEGVECLGFQNIPFQRFRFRTSRAGRRADITAVGRLIMRLRLENLPQLINVVRGEMALVGPEAVRTVFAERLIELMPFYSHRFTVKPGIFGWARLYMRRVPILNERSRIDYDLYYVKEGSPALDLDIVMRYLFGRNGPGRTADRMMAAFAVFWIATAVVFYVLVGYPILLAVFRRRAAPPVRKDLDFRTTVTVILAVYNGGAFLRAKLESLLALNYPPELLEILVVSDGSTDNTDAIAQEYAGLGVHLLRVPHAGKAAGLNAALEHANGELLFFTDVRQPLEPDALKHLVANFADPAVGAVTGELRLLKGEMGEQADMDLYWRYEVWARTRHSDIDSLFTATGCIYVERRSLAQPLPPGTISDDAIMPLRAFFRGYRVVFDPEAVAYDYPALPGHEFRRRLRTLAGLWQVHTRLPELFTSANRMRFHFLSHKFARLILPWALLAVFLATLALPASSFRSFLIANELLLFAIALIDTIVPKTFPLKRLSSPARSFLVMNAAALISVVVFFVPSSRLWAPTRVKQS